MIGKTEFPEPYEYKVSRTVKHMAGEALIEAAFLGQRKTCEMLLRPEFQADVNAQNRQGFSAFAAAYDRKRLGPASFLIDHGAEIRGDSKYTWHPVLKAAHDGWIPALNMFKYHKVDFNQGYEIWQHGKSRFSRPKKYIVYPLEAAFLGEHSCSVRFLLDNGADVNLFNPSFCRYTIRSFANDPKYSAFLDPETKEILMKKMRENPVPPAPQKPLTFVQRVCSAIQNKRA